MNKDTAILTSKKRASGDWLNLLFLTPVHGMVRLTWRRRGRFLNAPYLDGLQKGELLFRPSDERRPGRLYSFDVREVWPGVRGSYERLVTALHIGGMATALAGEGEPDGGLFELLDGMLNHLDREGDPGSLRIIFELKLLSLAGYGIALERCCCCGAEEGSGDACFSARDGGILCGRCRVSSTRSGKALSPGALSFMKRALALPLEKAARLRVGQALQSSIIPLLEEMAETILERQLPSSGYLRSLGRE